MRWILRILLAILFCLLLPCGNVAIRGIYAIVNAIIGRWKTEYSLESVHAIGVSVCSGCLIVLIAGVISLTLKWWRGKNGPKADCDCAIKSKDNDLLQRDSFVKALLCAFHGVSSLSAGAEYVALYAPWGDGKTSVINLLKEAKKDCIWGELNIWPDESYAHPACKLYCSFAKAFLSNWHWILAWRFWVMAMRLSAKDVVAEFGLTLSIPLGIVSAIFTIFCTIDGMRRRNGDRMRRYLGKEVVIVVDDIDRLPPEECMRILMMLRSFGDFPNVTYLIAAEQEHLLAAVSKELPEKHNDTEDARHFLEKFMTCVYRLPVISADTMGDMLRRELNEFCANHGIGNVCINQELLRSVVPYLRNVRSLRRYMSALDFEWTMQCAKVVYGTSLPSVNFNDVASLIAMRVFEPVFYDKLWPQGYQKIKDKSENIALSGPSCVSEDWMKENLIKYARDIESVQNFMKDRLGLRESSKYGSDRTGDNGKGFFFASLNDVSSLATYSIASAACAPNYFSSHVTDPLVPKKDSEQFLSLIRNESAFREDEIRDIVERLNANNCISNLLTILGAHRIVDGKFSRINLIKVLIIIASCKECNAHLSSDEVERRRGSIVVKVLDLLRRILCEREKKDKCLQEILVESLRNAEGSILLMAELVNEDMHKYGRDGGRDALLEKEYFDRVVAEFVWRVARIKNAAEGGCGEWIEEIWLRLVSFEYPQYGLQFKNSHKVELESYEWICRHINMFHFGFLGRNERYVSLETIDVCLGAEHVKKILDDNALRLSESCKDFYKDLVLVLERRAKGEPCDGKSMREFFESQGREKKG